MPYIRINGFPSVFGQVFPVAWYVSAGARQSAFPNLRALQPP